jgi:hypothetical protein
LLARTIDEKLVAIPPFFAPANQHGGAYDL